MKAIAISPPSKAIELIDLPEPKIETPTQVKVRVLEVGICGMDREEITGGKAEAPMGEKTLIIGHEMLGEVVQIGTKVKNFKTKDLVVIMGHRPCTECEMCKKGSSDLCESGKYTASGIKRRHGFQTQFVVDDEKYMVLVPPGLRNLAVLTEPTSVVEKAIDTACRLQTARLPFDPEQKNWLAGKRVLVVGLGPIGLLASMVLRLRGSQVTGMDVVSPHTLRPRILEDFGGKYIVAKEENARGEQFDLIIETAGIAKLNFELIPYLATNGVYVLTGVPGDGPPLEINALKVMRSLMRENQIVFGSVNAGISHFRQAINDLEDGEKKWAGAIQQLITKRIPYTQFDDVLHKHPSDEIKTVIEWATGSQSASK